jgi:hypothetical protein
MDEIIDAVKLSPNGSAVAQASSTDQWDLDSLRLKQNFDQLIGAEQILTTVSARRPQGQEWFRVHPDPSWRLETTILQMQDDREAFLVAPHLRSDLWDEMSPIILYTAVSRHGTLFLWPVRLPKDGRVDRFIETDMAAAKVAETKWTRRYWVPEIKAHKILCAAKLVDEPSWPQIGFKELLKIAFKDHFIDTLDHPAVKKLRGEL